MKFHSLAIWVLAAAASAQPQGASTSYLPVELEIELPPQTSPEMVQRIPEFRRLIGLRPNQPVSRQELRRSIERLYATGHLETVVVRGVEAPSGLKLVYQLGPKRKIARIEIQGGFVFSRSELLRVSKLAEGAEFYAERARNASQLIRDAYRRRGYAAAQVDIRATPVAENVALVISLADGEPTRIQQISFADDPGIALGDLTAQIGLSIGDVLDEDVLTAGIERLKALYRQRRYYQAKIAEPVFTLQGARARVNILIAAGPRFSVRFSGNRNFPDRVLDGVLNYHGEEPLDDSMLLRLSKRIATFYRYRGFYDVRVGCGLGHHSATAARLEVDIQEGFPLYNQEVRFLGNRALSARELEKIVVNHVSEKRPFPTGDVHPTDDPTDLEGRGLHSGADFVPEPEAKSVYVDDAYRESVALLTEMYRSQGYHEIQVALDHVDVDSLAHTSTVTYSINEGPQTRIESIRLLNVPTDTPALSGLVQSQVGEPLTDTALEETQRTLVQALRQRGYLFARVHHQVTLSGDRQRATVDLNIDPGPQVRVGRIIVQGLTRTSARDVLANVRLREGEVIDPQDLLESQRRLLLLGMFRQVALQLIDPDREETPKDVLVRLRERPQISADPGFGYTLVDGPLVVADAALPNVFGSGNNIVAYGRVNYVGASLLALSPSRVPTSTQVLTSDLTGLPALGLRGNIQFQHPRIYAFSPLLIGSRLDLIGERVFRPSFRFTRFAAVPGIDWTLLPRLTLSVQYELEYTRVLAASAIQQLLPTLEQRDQVRLRFPAGIFTLQTLQSSISLDYRNNPINPRSGILVTLTSEVTKDLQATLTDALGNRISSLTIFTLKTSGGITGYVPLSTHRQMSLAISLRGGKIFRLDPQSNTFAPKRFFLGGAQTLRGFPEEGLIPQDRRKDFHQELAACTALANPSGCTPASQVLLAGYQLPSEGGELFTLGKLELRFPAFGSWEGAIFFETGNLWLNQPSYRPWELRYVAGFGARYVTPIGPLAFDLGFNLSPDKQINEGAFNVHFSIGLF